MMAYVLEWGSLLFRWLHIIAAMAWIGASFFFMHLDASLKPLASIPPGKGGVDWQVHGGGFYEMKKFMFAPEGMPLELTWHKWQAYTTWISGFFLLVWIYYAQASLYLVDPDVAAITGIQASAIGIASLAGGWIVYDLICKSWIGRSEIRLAFVSLAFSVAVAYGYTCVFSGRGALVHTGALLATWMAGNVFLIIIPNQRKVIATLMAGETPDSKYGLQAKQRSTHNNYLTLAVVLLMMSNHYPILYSNPAIIPPSVLMIIVSSALIRYFYNVRHADHGKSPWWAWAVAAILLWCMFWLAMAASPSGREWLKGEGWKLGALTTGTSSPHRHVSAPPEVVEVVTTRCSMCHASEPVWDGIQIAPKAVLLDTPENIAREYDAIKLQAVIAGVMPPNNVTSMTDRERAVLANWKRDAD
ncbi:urate hydroxylase PuuD [Afipia felis]|uniref:Predicted membrane protein n=2 Tax=Afipia felis TaxID=1035 RepID=A0A380W737_AFIFE|nr:urate hydroxylase PuuD [Afipia felis]EKS31106.1 hypothetical protein HMPREF9697_03634 [Afipia felis ATCC 53690]SUU75850.1 Predicted membrane protein [Afipia felis]SUU83917.1 Predicted membrane protein [Afipia felis]